MKRYIRLALKLSLVGALSIAGCNLPSALEKPTKSARYELQKDAQGRLYRLDTNTGAVVQLDQVREDSKKQASTRARKASPVPTPVRQKPTLSEVAVAPDAPASPPQFAALAPSVKSGCTASAEATSQQVVVGSTSAGVFIQPTQARAPLATLSSGTRAECWMWQTSGI